METMKIELNKFINLSKVDFLSGRRFGEAKYRELRIAEQLKNEVNFELIIDENEIKGINDSFIKGFFSQIFKELKTYEKVKERFIIKADPYYEQLFDKNFRILASLQ